MRRSSLIVVTLAAVTAGAGFALDPEEGGVEETQRIRRHLSKVSRSLHAATPSSLTAEQRKAPATTLRWLDEYRDRGAFPHNHVVEGSRVSVFVDPHGTPCAVGYLMLRSREDELVEEIVRTDNLVRVHELRHDPHVASWLATRGITLEEAARIQPMYNWDPRAPYDDPPAYEAASVGTLVARMTYRGDVGDARPDEGGLHAFVRPGSNGTELGLVFRH